MLERSCFGDDRPKDAGQSSERLRQIPTGAKLRDELESPLSEINRRLGGKGWAAAL